MTKILILILGMLPASGSFAFGEDHDLWRQKMVEKLKLNEKQQSQLNDLKSKMQSEMTGLRQKKKDLREKLQSAFEGNEKEEKLKEYHKQLQEVQQQMGNLRFEKMLAIRNILNQKQRKSFYEFRSKEWRKHRHGEKVKGDDIRGDGAKGEDVHQ